jgi:hypothetical protein
LLSRDQISRNKIAVGLNLLAFGGLAFDALRLGFSMLVFHYYRSNHGELPGDFLQWTVNSVINLLFLLIAYNLSDSALLVEPTKPVKTTIPGLFKRVKEMHKKGKEPRSILRTLPAIYKDWVFHDVSGSSTQYFSREPYLPQDLSYPLSLDDSSPDQQDVLVFSDSDYYFKPEALSRIIYRASARGINHILIYTKEFPTLAGTNPTKTLSWFFDSENDEWCTTEVKTGRQYRHKIIDYNIDQLCFNHGLICSSHKVETLCTEGLSKLIYIRLAGVLNIETIDARMTTRPRKQHLEYLHPHVDPSGALELTFQTGSEITVSVAHSVNPRVSHEFTYREMIDIAMRNARAQVAMSVSDVEKVFEVHSPEKKQVNSERAAMIAFLFTQGWKPHSIGYHVRTRKFQPLYDEPNHYSVPGPSVESGKPCMVQIEKPIITGGVAPYTGINGDNDFVQNRVVKLANNAEPPEDIKGFVPEFIRFLRLNQTMVPWTEVQVNAKQNRPTQRARAVQREPTAMLSRTGKPTGSFQKAEAYPTINNSRAISTFDTDHRIAYSSYVYPLAGQIKKNEWYAFSKNPAELSQRVHDIGAKAKTITPTDFSRWDGRHSKWLAHFELEILLAAYPKKEHERLRKLWRVMYCQTVRTKHGVPYNTGWARPSGAADTSLFNTVDNAFIAYCVYRRMGMTPKAAWKALGLYGGDDGFSADADGNIYEAVAKDLGVKLTIEKPIEPKDPVPFLGRLFVEPKYSRSSIVDLKRCLAKFHLSHDKQTPPKAKYAEKVRAALITDAGTPIIRAMPGLIDANNNSTKVETSYWVRVAQETSTTFDQKESSLETLLQAAATNLGMTVQEILQIETELTSGKICPRTQEIVVKTGAWFRDIYREVGDKVVVEATAGPDSH